MRLPTATGAHDAVIDQQWVGVFATKRVRNDLLIDGVALREDCQVGGKIPEPDPAADKNRSRDMKRYAYGWITVGFFLLSIAGHWTFGWYAFLQDAAEHARQPVFSEYAI